MQLTLDLPDELSAALARSGQDLPRAVLEAQQHGVYMRYGPADLEHDRQAGDALQAPPAA